MRICPPLLNASSTGCHPHTARRRQEGNRSSGMKCEGRFSCVLGKPSNNCVAMSPEAGELHCAFIKCSSAPRCSSSSNSPSMAAHAWDTHTSLEIALVIPIRGKSVGFPRTCKPSVTKNRFPIELAHKHSRQLVELQKQELHHVGFFNCSKT